MKQVTNKNGEVLNELAIRHVGNGDLIKRKPNANQVYVINHYDKASKSYSCSDYYDMNKEIFIKSDKLVYVGFDF